MTGACLNLNVIRLGSTPLTLILGGQGGRETWGGDRGSREPTGRTWQNKRGERGQGKQREVSRLTGAGGWGGHERPQPRERTRGLTEGREGRARTAGGEGAAGGPRIARQDVGRGMR